MRHSPDQWEWIPELSAKNTRIVGETILDLMLAGERWVHRRVETLTLVNTEVVRRGLSVDFTLPKKLYTPLRTSDKQDLYIIPFTMLPRTLEAMRFDVRDQHGLSMPMFLKEHSSRLTAAALLALASRVLRDKGMKPADVLRGALGNVLSTIPFTKYYREAQELAESILFPESEAWRVSRADIKAREILSNDSDFPDFLALVTGSSLVSIPYVGKPGIRQILKLTYDEGVRVQPLEGDDRTLRMSLGWVARTTSIPIALSGGAGSYHVQVDAPPNMEFTATQLRSHQPLSLVRKPVSKRSLPEPSYIDFNPGYARHSHLYVPKAHQLASGRVILSLRVERESILSGGVWAGAVIAIVLWVYYQYIDQLVRQSGTVVAFFALIPGLVTIYYIRPGEHPLARRLLRFPRVLLTISALLPLVAVGAIAALDKDSPLTTFTRISSEVWRGRTLPVYASANLKHVMLGLAVSATIVVGGLAVNLVLPRRGRLNSKSKYRDKTPQRATPKYAHSKGRLCVAGVASVLLVTALWRLIAQSLRRRQEA